MARGVKALVDLFEARSSEIRASTSPSPPNSVSRRSKDSAFLAGGSQPQSPSSPSLCRDTSNALPNARLLKPHSQLRRREPSQIDEIEEVGLLDYTSTDQDPWDLVLSVDDHDTLVAGHGRDTSADVTDELLSATGRKDLRPSVLADTSKTKGKTRFLESQEFELDSLTSHTMGGDETSLIQSRTFSVIASLATVRKHSDFDTDTLLAVPSGQHTPVPLSTVFARNAAPIALPRLDNYISSLPAAQLSFAESKGKGKDTSVPMFPPMDRLAKSGKTLADLEHNAEINPWWSRTSIFSALTSFVLGIAGSSAVASFYSVQGLFDTVQIFALILGTIASHTGTVGSRWRTLFLVTIPNILALNFAQTLYESIALLLSFMAISGLLLYFFYRLTSRCVSDRIPEGHQRFDYPKHSWLILVISFLLTVIYLPLSTMAFHVLVWSDDLWVVPNPYTNATTNPPEVAPLGPADEYRPPLDFCWTTTMSLNEVNYAPFVVICAIVCFAGLTVWFPTHLYRTIKRVVPIVDPYTELGAARSNSDMDREYQRVLNRDNSPLAFLYNGFRRGWGSFESIFLLAKFTTLLITAVIDPDNCLFRTLSRSGVEIARQVVLLAAMLFYLVHQCISAPFLNPVNNASEFTSRLNYVLTSIVALLVVLDVPGEDIWNTAVLYIIYIATYGLSVYFTIINWSVTTRLVKRLARRIDFSIDIFSPRLDLSPNCPHTKRRIWQEAISVLFLTTTDCTIPKTQKMQFKQARDNEYPPYLLNFAGTPGERHVENLKILRDCGSHAYYKAVALTTGPESGRFRHLQEIIQTHFVGPDSYWKPPPSVPPPKCTNFFGNAWWIPFPPTLVIRYDDGPLKVLQDVADLELYVEQNSSEHIQRKREIRLALRALDGQMVIWPYDYTQNVGNDDAWWCCRRRYGAQTVVHYETATFSIQRHGELLWEGIDLGSGFAVQLAYDKKATVDGAAIGLTVDFELTQPLARFLALNERAVTDGLVHLEAVLRGYRHHGRRECEWKLDVLTYQDLTAVYNAPRPPGEVVKTVMGTERDVRVRELVVGSEEVLGITYERLSAVVTSELAAWWYIFWDDLWRRNYDTISALKKHATDFNPHYPTSIAYKPLPRAALEAFLTQRGLLHKKPKWRDFFDAGFLNKMYLRMNDIIFHGSSEAIILHLGDDRSELDMEEVDAQTLVQPSTLGTGAGTDYDDLMIRARPLYRWEGILEDPLRKTKAKHRQWLTKLAVWFGLTPFWRHGIPSQGLTLDVQLMNGKYILLEDAVIRTDIQAMNSRSKPV